MVESVQILESPACWDRLGTAGRGRVAVVVRGHPFIFPVDYVVDDGALVFHVADGVNLHGVFTSPSIALEADGVDETGRVWSVVVVGRAHAIAERDRIIDLDARTPEPWEDEEPFLIEIRPDDVTGRIRALR